jgi:FtsZ-binding cell division protein ZapB
MEQQMKRIQEKVQQLIKTHHLLQLENEQLKRDVKIANERQDLYKNKMDGLEERVTALKMATGQLNDTDKKEVERKLNHYLKEIDRCITMLSE